MYRSISAPRAALLLLAAAFVLWPVWFLWGLRFTNHDDIAFGMAAVNPQLGWLEYADWVARSHRRVQAFLGMPLVLAGNWLALQPYGDLILAGQAGLLLTLLVPALRGLMPARSLVLLLVLLGSCFAVHYYFSAPPGYALMGLFFPLLLFAVLALTRRALAAGDALPWAPFFFAAVMVLGPEYNFIALTLPVLLLLWFSEAPSRLRLRYAVGFVGVWGGAAGVYLGYRLLQAGTDQAERVSLAFAPGAWLSTSWVLFAKALLPVGLWVGIDLQQPTRAGFPILPRRLDWEWMVGQLAGNQEYAVALVVMAAAFYYLLGERHWGLRARMLVASGSLVLMTVPILVLALSQTYQHIVLAGYLQGHLASAYAQAGLLGLLVAALGASGARSYLRVPAALLLAMLSVCTLAYNLAMRDAMSANRQRWSAFALLAELAPDATLHAPDFWQISGVSELPASYHPLGGSYWHDYARFVLHVGTILRGPAEDRQPGDPQAGFFPVPDGEPLVWLRGPAGVRLASRRPVAFTAGGRSWGVEDWTCRTFCELLPDGLEPADISLPPGPTSPLARMLLPRGGAFGAAGW